MSTRMTRREMLRYVGLGSAAAVLAACAPKVVKETVVVEKEVEKAVEKIVKETVIVAGTPKVVEKIVTVTPGPAAPVTIRMPQAMGDNGQPVFEAVAKTFMDKNPNVTVKIDPTFDWDSQKYLVQAAAGTAPDIIWGDEHWSFLLSSKGVLLDLNPFIDGSGFNKDNYADVLGAFTWAGKLFSFPIWIGCYGMFFNMDLLAEAGLELPPDDWNYDDLLAMAKKLTKDKNGDGEPDQYGIYISSHHNRWGSAILAYGDEFYSPDGTEFVLCEKPNYDGLQFVIDMIHKHKVAPTPEITEALAGGGDPFMTGACAIVPGAPWSFAKYRKAADFTWDCAPMPLGPTGGKGTVMTSDSLSIYQGSENPDVAWDFIQELLSFEAQKSYCEEFKGPQPVHKEAAKFWLRPQDPPEHQQLFIDALDYCGIPMWSMYSHITNPLFSQALAEAFSGNQTLDDVMASVCGPINEAIQAEIEKLDAYSG